MEDNFNLKNFLKENQSMERGNPYLRKSIEESDIRSKVREIVLNELSEGYRDNMRDEREYYDFLRDLGGAELAGDTFDAMMYGRDQFSSFKEFLNDEIKFFQQEGDVEMVQKIESKFKSNLNELSEGEKSPNLALIEKAFLDLETQNAEGVDDDTLHIDIEDTIEQYEYDGGIYFNQRYRLPLIKKAVEYLKNVGSLTLPNGTIVSIDGDGIMVMTKNQLGEAKKDKKDKKVKDVEVEDVEVKDVEIEDPEVGMEDVGMEEPTSEVDPEDIMGHLKAAFDLETDEKFKNQIGNTIQMYNNEMY